jgi:hypothetical protein
VAIERAESCAARVDDGDYKGAWQDVGSDKSEEAREGKGDL